DVYAKLVAEFPEVPSYRQELAHSHLDVASTLRDLRKREALYRQALDGYMKLVFVFPDVPAYPENLASTQRAMGDLLKDLRKRASRQAWAVGAKRAAMFPAVPGYRHLLVDCYGSLGLLLTDGGKRADAEAEAAYHQALDLAEKLAAEFPDAPHYLVKVAASQ